MIDQRLTLDKAFTTGTVLELHRFAMNTVKRIMEKIQRLDIKDTGKLMNSIKATVHTNAGGKQALVQFFYLYYGECVEQAVGKYYDVDDDLGDGIGVKSMNIKAPEIAGVGYGPMKGTFSGVPSNARREKTHRPRPFLRSEIKKNVAYVGYKLMKNGRQLIEMHMINDINDLLTEDIKALMMSPFAGRKNISFKVVQKKDEKGMLYYDIDSSQGRNM